MSDRAIRNRAQKDRKRRKKLKERLRAEGCSEELIERIIAKERQKDLVRRHGSEDEARRARAKSSRNMPDDTGYEPDTVDPLLRGPGRADGITARVVVRGETITDWQYDRIVEGGRSS